MIHRAGAPKELSRVLQCLLDSLKGAPAKERAQRLELGWLPQSRAAVVHNARHCTHTHFNVRLVMLENSITMIVHLTVKEAVLFINFSSIDCRVLVVQNGWIPVHV